MIDLVKNRVSQAMAGIVSDISGGMKRHDALVLDIGKAITKNRSRAALAEILSRKLKKQEGVIFTTQIYSSLTACTPLELEMMSFQKELEQYGLSLCCIYHKKEKTSLNSALFIIVHRSIKQALDYKDRINEVLGVTKQKPMAMLVKTFIKITENMGKDVTLEQLIQSCTLLTGDEVYCVSMDLLVVFQIDPSQLQSLLDKAGFIICPLLKPEVDVNTPAVYQAYERLMGMMISRSNFGIEWGKANIGDVLHVCNTAESDLLTLAMSGKTLQ